MKFDKHSVDNLKAIDNLKSIHNLKPIDYLKSIDIEQPLIDMGPLPCCYHEGCTFSPPRSYSFFDEAQE